jgi:hypothetical protein
MRANWSVTVEAGFQLTLNKQSVPRTFVLRPVNHSKLPPSYKDVVGDTGKDLRFLNQPTIAPDYQEFANRPGAGYPRKYSYLRHSKGKTYRKRSGVASFATPPRPGTRATTRAATRRCDACSPPWCGAAGPGGGCTRRQCSWAFCKGSRIVLQAGGELNHTGSTTSRRARTSLHW